MLTTISSFKQETQASTIVNKIFPLKQTRRMNIGKSISQTSFSLHLKPTASTFYCDYQGELYYNNINKMGLETLSWNFSRNLLARIQNSVV